MQLVDFSVFFYLFQRHFVVFFFSFYFFYAYLLSYSAYNNELTISQNHSIWSCVRGSFQTLHRIVILFLDMVLRSVFIYSTTDLIYKYDEMKFHHHQQQQRIRVCCVVVVCCWAAGFCLFFRLLLLPSFNSFQKCLYISNHIF